MQPLRLGYKASAEQFGLVELLEFSIHAEEAGFGCSTFFLRELLGWFKIHVFSKAHIGRMRKSRQWHMLSSP